MDILQDLMINMAVKYFRDLILICFKVIIEFSQIWYLIFVMWSIYNISCAVMFCVSKLEKSIIFKIFLSWCHIPAAVYCCQVMACLLLWFCSCYNGWNYDSQLWLYKDNIIYYCIAHSLILNLWIISPISQMYSASTSWCCACCFHRLEKQLIKQDFGKQD